VEISRDPVSGEVHALRGPAFAGVQFHPESVLSQHGVQLLRDILGGCIPTGSSCASGDPKTGSRSRP
jgi:phenazine biosynthesis protein phzE